MVKKRNSNKLVEKFLALCEVLAIEPIPELFVRIKNLAQDVLVKVKEASSRDKFSPKTRRKAALWTGLNSVQTVKSYTGQEQGRPWVAAAKMR